MAKKKEVCVWAWRDKTGYYLDQDKHGENGCIFLEYGKQLKLAIGECRKYKLVEVKEK